MSVELAFDQDGEGPAVLLLHGLTATRRYVVMGSRSLERGGHRVIACDARGHGASPPAPVGEHYDYGALVDDVRALMDRLGIERAVLAGASMGAHTALRLALEAPERVSGLVLITPAFDPDDPRDDVELARWDALSHGLRDGGVEGFIEAYGEPQVPEAYRETIVTVLRQRLERHERPDAVADALREVPRSRPFEAWAQVEALEGVPTAVVGSRDEADPGHPLAVAERYAQRLDGAELRVEPAGESPLAWRGAQLSKVIAAITAQA